MNDVPVETKSLPLIEVATAKGPIWVHYALKRSRRARYLRLSVLSGGQTQLTVPWTCSFDAAREFLKSQGDWLVRQLAIARKAPTLLQHLQKTPHLSAHGHTLQVQMMHTRFRAEYLYRLDPAEIIFKVGMDETVERGLKVLLRAFAAETLPHRVRHLAQSTGLTVRRISVRDQSSRWGSCSCSGTLSLNWRLVLLTPELQDHVIYHELAHLREMNHSDRFWACLRQFDRCADHNNHRLSTSAAAIMSLGR